MLFSLGELLALAALGYGAWLSFRYAGKYDFDRLPADIVTSHSAPTRGPLEHVADYRGNDQVGKNTDELATP